MIDKPHRFYHWPTYAQWAFIIITAIIVLLIFGIIIYLSILHLTLLPFLLFPLTTILISFVDTPFNKLTKKLYYYAPLFIVEKKTGKYILHGGTFFDYLFVLGCRSRGIANRKIVLMDLLNGLLNLIDEIEQEKSEKLTISGTSYFFNERTARRFGFDIQSPEVSQVILMMLNYLPITLSYSMIDGKLAFPKLNKIKKASISGPKLVNEKDKILRLIERLQ